MPVFRLNDVELSADPGVTILQAALTHGIDIPHFCYHPYLPVDGCCRMCLVEVERMPKLVIACNTPVTDGMVVQTESNKVKQARARVLELLLANHPLDCPICDQAGECKLQQYAFNYGPGHSRCKEPKRKGRKRFKIGTRLVFDEERCILCRRCIRFCSCITKTNEIGLFERGDKTRIDIYPGKPIDNPYSINLADICPVGALTSSDFRFKVRAWFLRETPSVCPGCSNNCSITISHYQGKIYRFLPRVNERVNRSWICDYGRTIYKSIHAANRMTIPQVKYKNNLVPVSWKEAFSFAAGRLRKYAGNQIGWIISPSATNEECFVFLKLIKNIFHSDHVVAVTSFWNDDDLLIKPEKAANTFGLRKAGIEIYKNLQQSGTTGLINEGGLSALYIIGNEITEIQDFYHDTLRIMTKLEFLIVQSTHESDLSEMADVVFPSACFAEKAGSFLNTEGIMQHFDRAIPPPGQTKPDLEIANTLAGLLGNPLS